MATVEEDDEQATPPPTGVLLGLDELRSTGLDAHELGMLSSADRV
jgi:hypothetical protein